MTAPSSSSLSPSPIPCQSLRVGEPDVSGPLAVYPLFGAKPKLDYEAFAASRSRVTITEREGGPSVNDLTVRNKGRRPVLLYEGEELLGAMQNRVVDVSVLIAAHAKRRRFP